MPSTDRLRSELVPSRKGRWMRIWENFGQTGSWLHPTRTLSAVMYQCFHSKHQDASASRHTTSACAGLLTNHPLSAFLEINNVGKVAVGISFPATSSDVLFVHFWWAKQQKNKEVHVYKDRIEQAAQPQDCRICSPVSFRFWPRRTSRFLGEPKSLYRDRLPGRCHTPKGPVFDNDRR